MSLLGHYVNCDDAVCMDCWDPEQNCESCGLLLGITRLSVRTVRAECERLDDHWDGFESWDEPVAIFRDSESDTPTHCVECRRLIPHALTSAGYEYVKEHVKDVLDTCQDAALGVVAQWWREYGEEYDASDMYAIITTALKADRE